MAQCWKHHKELDEHGIGQCSVPMFMSGMPAGFCDKPAYGKPPECKRFRNAQTGRMVRVDRRYSGYVPFLACYGHGGPESRAFHDGNAWCAVMPDFVNLQESPAGFGDSPEDARQALAKSKQET